MTSGEVREFGDAHSGNAQFGYTQFGAWYDAYRIDVLEPALAIALAALYDVLAGGLSERDYARIRSVTGRIKSKPRTWRKIRQPRYRGRIETVDDIAHVLDDLVGLRVTCINLRDIDMVQSTLDSVPRQPSRKHKLWLDPSSERDYVVAPKESGYRGWHVNTCVAVLIDGQRVPVTAELQVRTLLQDSWGELTHEDTYSKDGALPPLVEVLSKRMADLFATLDDIAEDLRTELDRIDDDVFAEESAEESIADVESEQAGDAAVVLLDRWHHLDRPVDLASLAWTLQHEFGAEISDDWFGHRTFKRFLRHAVPDGEISTGRQAYLLPPSNGRPEQAGTPPAAASGEPSSDQPDQSDQPDPSDGITTIPPQAWELRRVDPGFPVLERDQWPVLYKYLADEWSRLGTRPPTARFANQLTRSARDRAGEAGIALSRRHLGYVAKTVLNARDTGEPMEPAALGSTFAASTVQRMIDLRILNKRDRATATSLTHWLTAG